MQRIKEIIKEASERADAIKTNVGWIAFFLITIWTSFAGLMIGYGFMVYSGSKLMGVVLCLLFSNLLFFKFAYQLFGGKRNEFKNRW